MINIVSIFFMYIRSLKIVQSTSAEDKNADELKVLSNKILTISTCSDIDDRMAVQETLQK
ncbi:hypothetical protein [Peptoniphilus sp.]|uniref:hypothetical protein n=1 Tax=Peptoniphilus sp. TaxID=1971214 RepID=UPI0039941802